MTESTQNLIKYFVVGGLCLIFLLSIFLGFIAGKNKSASGVVASNTLQVKKALAYFYNDQGRYPTEAEFSDRGSFGLYISQPLSNFSAGSCKNLIVYTILPTHQPELLACMPSSSTGFKAGTNTIMVGK
jgi:hypothetical protein